MFYSTIAKFPCVHICQSRDYYWKREAFCADIKISILLFQQKPIDFLKPWKKTPKAYYNTNVLSVQKIPQNISKI